MITKELPVGYHKFAKSPFVNYQMNRWWSLGFTVFDEIAEAGRQIKTFDDNRVVFSRLAESAESDGRLKNAAFYWRAAEFLTAPASADKTDLYERFSDTFHRAFAGDQIESQTIPYAGGSIVVHRLAPRDTDGRIQTGGGHGTVVIHGGFDSFIEEFYCFWLAFAQAGYEVIAFDGPGQGATLYRHGVASDHDWEKPVGAILDYFDRDDVTLLGISFGGYWCVRAAAHENRVKRLIIDAPFYDLMAHRSNLTKGLVRWMLNHRRFLNWSIRSRARVIPTIEHVVNQVLMVNRRLEADPALAAEWILSMNAEHISSDRVDQDVFILVGEADRFQSPKLYELQRAALVNARSVEGRIFTRAESAANHCQMGNLGLALDSMTEWLGRHQG